MTFGDIYTNRVGAANNQPIERRMTMASLAEQVRETKDMTEAEKIAYESDEIINTPCYHCLYLNSSLVCTYSHPDADCIRDKE